MSDHQTPQSLDPFTSPDIEHEGVQPQALMAVARMTVRYIQMGKGHLKIYTRTVNDVVVLEAFTLASLADCMGLAVGTLEGRYHRGRLFNWKVDIPTGTTRPVRGFPLAQLKEVMTILSTRGARVEGAGTNTERVTSGRVGNGARYPLQYVIHNGRRYITIPALADHYGVSTTTIRGKLVRSGLLSKGENLNSPSQGGRPRRGWPASMEAQLVDAIENGAQFLSEIQTVFNRVMHPPREPERLSPVQEWALGQQVARVQEAARLPMVDQASKDVASQLEGLLAKSKPLADVAPNPDTMQPLQEWVDKLEAAPEVWQFDAVIEAMHKAGLSDDQISKVVTMQATRPAASQAERSGAGA